MKDRIKKNRSLIFILIIFVLIAGCGNTEEKKKNVQNPAVSTNQVQPAATAAPAAGAAAEVDAKQADSTDIAVSVDGNVLKKSEIEKDIKQKLAAYKGQIPADKMKEARTTLKKQMIDEFIMRILMTNEVEKRKIAATDQEIKTTMDQIKASLPPDQKLENFLKENKISREYIVLGIKVKKMIQQEAGKKAKPSQKEITKFYDDNKDQFIIPENVHVRHILIAFTKDDTDSVKAEKKVKIENLRKQVVDGADFAEIARKNSDCPSKDNGGDLGQIRKDQTVKPFEDAAFSQEINAIGPVIATDYGYHVIQVLERNAQKITTLEEVQGKISSYLEQQKQAETFTALLKKLRENAKVIVNEK
jgi:peptidyl-prolyl cis-trans isomerase C